MNEKLKPYWRALPYIFTYQIITKALLALWIIVLRELFQLLLESAGRVALTSGDFTFLFTTWQGWIIMLLGLVSLLVYVAFDLNAKIILARKLIKGEETSVWKCMDEAFKSISSLINIRGIGVAVYIALIAPLLGFGVSISLTKGFEIPKFITSVIADSNLYMILTTFAMLVFLSIGVANLFILHGAIIDKLPLKEAGAQSRQLIHDNWKDYLKQNILFIAVMIVALGIVVAISLVLPLAIIQALPLSAGVGRVLTITFVTFGCAISALADLFATPLYLMKMTQLFFTYRDGECVYDASQNEREYPHKIRGKAFVAVMLVAAVVIMTANFDRIFPAESQVGIVAHRAGGVEAAENTISGIENAIADGAYGTEIDIQRTKDGHYILLHDGSFKRVAGDEQKPDEMNLKQIQKLKVDGEPIPTIEETMDACKGKIVLFAELKGSSADKIMADDMVKLIREKDMADECVLISLKYNLIDYIEDKYPDIQTGFLAFATFGETARLNCDYIGLEEESASARTIMSIHHQGKKVLVWTPNTAESQKNFLCSDADGMITDEVKAAVKLKEELSNRTDLQRMVDRFMMLVK